MNTCKDCKYYHKEYCYVVPPTLENDTIISINPDRPACKEFKPKAKVEYDFNGIIEEKEEKRS